MLGINFSIANTAYRFLNNQAAPPSVTYLFLTSQGDNFVTSDGKTLEYTH